MKTIHRTIMTLLIAALAFVTARANVTLNEPVVSDSTSFRDEFSTKKVKENISNLSIVGSFNNWNCYDGSRIEMSPTPNGFMSVVELPYCEFKFISFDANDDITWYGGRDDNGVGYFLISEQLIGEEISLVDGSNFSINGGTYTFIVTEDVSGMNLVVYEGVLSSSAILTVNLPSNASDGRYKDMYLSVASVDGATHNRRIITNKTSYSFYVPTNTTYNVSVITGSGAVAGEKRDIAIGSDDVTVSFASLLQPQTVSLAVTLPDGVDITAETGITWTDKEGHFLAQGAILNGMIQGQELNYELKLPEEQIMYYIQPAKQNYTVKTQANSILVWLEPFRTARITGTVYDASTGRPLPATIIASQSLNGKRTKSVTTTTNNKGQYTLDVISAPTQVTATAQWYVSQTVELDNLSDTTTLEPFSLNPIEVKVVQTRFTYRSSAPMGQSVETLDYYDDYQNVSFTIRNITRNKAVTPLSVQYPEIILSDDVAEGDIIEVTAHSLKNVFNDVSATCTITSGCGDVTLPLVELGGIDVRYTSSEAESVSGMLYNNAGEQVARDVYRDGALSLSHLPDGNYTLVTMQTSGYNSVLTLAGLSDAGLTAVTDYKTTSVSVISGTIVSVEVGNVPNSELLAFTGSNTHFTANKSSLTIGNYVTLSANVDFKKVYQNGVRNVQLLVDLPEGCDFVPYSVLRDNFATDYSYMEGSHRISVNMPNGSGFVKLCAIPTAAGVIRPFASVRFTYEGKTITEPIGAASLETKNIEIRVPSIVDKPEVVLSGSCPLKSQVNIYDNGDLIGTTTANGYNWSTKCALRNSFNLSTHEIFAKATTPQGVELLSETATCVYDKNAIEVSKVMMYHDNPEVDITYAIKFDFKNPSNTTQSYVYYIYNREFTFTIDFTQNDTTKITNVVLHVKTGDLRWTSLPARYDENLNCWVTSGEFGHLYDGDIPINVAVSYDYDTRALLSAEVFDASVNYYSDLQTTFQHETLDINQALDELNTLWNNDDYDSETSIARRHELYESLGITINDGPTKIYTDEEMDFMLAEFEQVLADSLGFQPDLLFQQSVEEINAMTEGFTIGHCAGMNEAQLLGEGYQRMEKDDGSCVYIFTDETAMKIADLVNDVYYELDPQSGNPLLAPLVELAQGNDDFEARMNAYSERVGSLCGGIREKLVTIAEVLDDIFKQLLARNNKLEANLNLCNNQIKYLKSLEHQTLDQSLRLAKYEFYQARYTKELAVNNKIKDFLLDLDTKSLRLGKIKFNGITGMGKYVRLANKAFVAYDIYNLKNNWEKDVAKIFDTYFMIPNPCKDDEVGAAVMRTAVISLGVSAGAYYAAQFLLDLASLSSTLVGSLAALPTGGTSLSIVAASIGVALASYAAGEAWNRNFDKLVAYQVNSIKLLSCYTDPSVPNTIPNPYWHHSGNSDVKPTIDPSGFVYEAVQSNRLQGVTATIYYKETVEDMYGNPQENEVLWDAEEFAQKNPLFTDENGMYQWDVPQGMWQVRFNKTGYEPTRSEWLPVPPPQLDVNIGMTQLRQPEVAMVHAYKDAVEITFDKYMRPGTLTTDNIQLTQNNKTVSGTIELLNAEQGDNETLASKIQFVPTSDLSAGSVTLTVKTPVESYAGLTMNSEFQQSFDVERRVRVIAVDSLVNVGYGESRKVTVAALPVDIASGATLRVTTNQPVIADVEEETFTLDKHGRAEITINGNLPGSATLTLSVDGFDLRSHTKVLVVDESAMVTARPVASVQNGKVFGDQIVVELSCETPNAVIYYTINGSCPCDEEERIRYESPITISETTTLKAIAMAPDRYESDIATYYYFQSSAVTEVNTDSPVRITPTKVTDGFSVTGHFESCDIRVFSLNGAEVVHQPAVRQGQNVSMSGVSAGVYIVVATVNGRPYPSRVIKVE